MFGFWRNALSGAMRRGLGAGTRINMMGNTPTSGPIGSLFNNSFGSTPSSPGQGFNAFTGQGGYSRNYNSGEGALISGNSRDMSPTQLRNLMVGSRPTPVADLFDNPLLGTAMFGPKIADFIRGLGPQGSQMPADVVKDYFLGPQRSSFGSRSY